MNRFAVLFLLAVMIAAPNRLFAQEANEWVKYENNPVLGGELGVCFDVTLIQEDGLYKMWFSWRAKHSMGYTESVDGVHWKEPVVVLAPCDSGWEKLVNRSSVVHKGELYYMWYTGQTDTTSQIGFATSKDGIHWTRQSDKPVLTAEAPWEKVAVMCPDVRWNEETQLFEMRYSGGEQYEPNAIGYATSPAGSETSSTWSMAVEPMSVLRLIPARNSAFTTYAPSPAGIQLAQCISIPSLDFSMTNTVWMPG